VTLSTPHFLSFFISLSLSLSLSQTPRMCVLIGSPPPLQMLYTTVCCSSKYAHKNYRKKYAEFFFKQSNRQIRTDVKIRVFNAGLLARSQFLSGSSCDRPTRSRFSVVFLDPRANVVLVPKFHVALHASRADLAMVTFKHFALI
jgi:hypothetical protein